MAHVAPESAPASDPSRFADDNGLHVRDLAIAFPTDAGPLTAVDRVSFSLARGQTTGLVGESGCGKSVTALALLGLVPEPGRAIGGEIRLHGRDLLGLDAAGWEEVRGRRIAMVFQEPMTALNPVFTVGDQIAEGLRVHFRMPAAQAWERAVDLLAKVGIPDARHRATAYPHELSGGMRQRVMIAIAVACEPDILIADEPTTALDVTIQAQILDLILSLQAEMAAAVLFISHDLSVVSEIADDILVMYAGRIVESGPTAEVISDPRHPYTRGLIDTLPGSHAGEHLPHRRLPAIPGTVPDLRALPPGCRFSDRCPDADDACRIQEPRLAPCGSGRATACLKSPGREPAR